ncbi:MAG: hypothetical protein M1818_005006 [Claussenomyces sp. TS43310]|nr:MAG: hypothetical protein M1818_005006 [Claussenomyces sp. TS43310]
MECLRSAILSLDAFEHRCLQNFEKNLWTALRNCFVSLGDSPLRAYQSQLEIDKSLISMEPDDLEKLIEPCNTTSQLLLAYLVGVHLIMRPIACLERKTYTVTMYACRMTSWIGNIFSQVKPEYQKALEWPLLISKLHTAKRLEDYTLAPNPPQVNPAATFFGGSDACVIADSQWMSEPSTDAIY